MKPTTLLPLAGLILAAATSSLSAQTVINLFPTQDVSLRSGTATATNGTNTELLVGTISTTGGSTGADINGADASRAFLSFDLSAPAVTSALAGQTITSVTLTFTINSLDSGPSASNVVSYSLFQSGTFDASTATWSTGRPASTGSVLSLVSINPSTVTAGSAVTFVSSSDFTSIVATSLGGTLNLLAKQTSEGTPSARELLRFRSVDFTGTTSDPVLTITATAVPEPSAFAAFAGLGIVGFAATRRRRRI
jgi:hypothetical protein